jgi:hypothetical protein
MCDGLIRIGRFSASGSSDRPGKFLCVHREKNQNKAIGGSLALDKAGPGPRPAFRFQGRQQGVERHLKIPIGPLGIEQGPKVKRNPFFGRQHTAPGYHVLAKRPGFFPTPFMGRDFGAIVSPYPKTAQSLNG